MNLREILSHRPFKESDPEAEQRIIDIFGQYDRMLHKYSYTGRCFDPDLYSECKVTLLHCIRNYNFDELHFKKQFKEHQLDSDKGGLRIHAENKS